MAPTLRSRLFPLLFLASAASAQTESAWPVNETAHFVIHHERGAASLGDYNLLERVYETLHAELWSLVPWMSTQKTQVYLYATPDSYHLSRFHPPPWSGGLMETSDGQKILAIYEPVDVGIVAHELTHLYFHSYFDEKGVTPPVWLDEGLAAMLQAQALSKPDPRDKGPVLSSTMPLTDFIRTRPGNDAPSAWVGGWYAEAQSVTWFVKRGHIEASFADFCSRLRDGQTPAAALSATYGYADLAAFDDDWQKWRPTKPVGVLRGIGDR